MYRILADENVERATINYLRKLGHNVERTAGVLFQRDQTLSAREVGDVVHELSRYLDQSDVALEYVSGNWL